MKYGSPEEVFVEMAALTVSYKTLSYRVLGATGKRAGGGYASFVKDVEWRTPVLVGLGKDYLTVNDQ